MRVDQLMRASGARRYRGCSSHGFTHSSRKARAWASCTSGAADGCDRNCSAKSQRTTAAISLVFILLAATFFILGFANYGGHTNGIKVGGWVGIATAAAAWYASFAAVTNSTFARTILPVIPLKREPGAAPAGAAAREATTAERGPGAPS